MNDKRDFDRAVDRWLNDGSDATPPEVIDAVLLAARSTPQERDFRGPWRTTSMTSYLRVAAVIALVAIGSTAAMFTLGPAGFGGTNATPSPSPVLIARGDFVEHDWGRVEFEASRVGSGVTGYMTIAAKEGWGPVTVGLQCVRETDDGRVMIGGFVTVRNQIVDVGNPAWVVIKRGNPSAAMVLIPIGEPATQTTDCLANMGDDSEPYAVLDGGIEFGPPIPVLVARGNFATIGGEVEFEAIREGSDVTGHMTVSGQGQNEPWTGTVDLQCVRETRDGLIMIGGVVIDRSGEEAPQEGHWAGIYLERGSPVEASVWPRPSGRVRGGQCVEFLDEQLMWERSTHLEPVDFADPVDGTIELGP